VTYPAWTFVLTSLDTGRPLALGLICPDAEFIGLSSCASETKAPVLEHRQLAPGAWRNLRHELSVGLSPAPVARAGPIHQVLAGNAALTIQYLSSQLIALAPRDEVAGVLDRFLARQAEAYDSTREA
jgi:hypothetical protein